MLFGSLTLSGTGVVWTAGMLTAIIWIIDNCFFKRNKSIRCGKNVPGSMGWPIFGHLPYLTNLSNMYSFMEYYTTKYGPIFRIKLGSCEAFVINDYNLIKKAFNNKDFITRPKFLMGNVSSMKGHGLLLSKEKIWREQRPFAVSQLRYLGMGKSSLESTIQAETNALFTEWKKTIGKPIDVNVSLNISITNIIWSIVAGERMEYGDPKFIKFTVELNKRLTLFSTMSPMAFIPWMLRVCPKKFFNLDNFTEIMKSFNSFAQEIIDGHRKVIDYENPKDFVDHFLVRQKKEENNPETTFTDTQLLVTIFDLFAAGGETTATTLRWALLLISWDLTVQKRIQDEIDQIIGHDRNPNIFDSNRMPYTVAVIHEVARYADIGRVTLRASSKDTIFEGYHFPKNVTIIGFLGGAHRNHKYWAKPYEFYPEHFLDAEGKLLPKVEGFVPFSIGKRSCPGEQLAQMELFYFIASFFQHFNVRLAESPRPNLENDPKSGLVRWPNPYKVIMEERHHY